MGLDQYYTKPDVAKKCIEVMLEYADRDIRWIEPSAGTGSFIFDKTFKAYDLEPKAIGVEKANWFDVVLPDVAFGVYGNPPYGERNTLSKKFIEKVVNNKHCKVIAFLLPTSFNKHTLQKVFTSKWILLHKYTPNEDSFIYNGDDYKIPCVFQVWVRKSFITGVDLREVERKDFDNKHFSIVKSDGDIFVMGAAPKTVKFPNEVNSNNRGYWLKSKIPLQELIANIQSTDWRGNSSASGGVYWLNKTEFLNCYEKHNLKGE